jgi:hypothetical protein
MAIHVICPSLRCRKILELADNARGTVVTCRYCDMHFRVPHIKRTPATTPTETGSSVAVKDGGRSANDTDRMTNDKMTNDQ